MGTFFHILRRPVGVAVLIAVLALSARLVGLGDFMTVDEEQWMLRSGMYYHKLFDRADPGGTFTTTHPGVTTQWLAGAGVYLMSKQLGTGVDTSNLRDFRLAATVPIVVAISVLIGVVVYLLARLMGVAVAWWSGVLLSSEPYLLGMSQIVHVDMLLALFMVGSVLALLLFRRERSWSWLTMSAILCGFAFATKLLPALWLVPYFLLMLVVLWWTGRMSVAELVRMAGWGLGVAVLTLYVIWPALWVKTDLHRNYEKDVVSVVTQDHVTHVVSDEPVEPTTFYWRTVAGRVSLSTLLVAVGVTFAALRQRVATGVLRHMVGWLPSHGNRALPGKLIVTTGDVLWLAVFSLSFLIFISLAAKKADRYALPALLMLPLLAGAGWAVVLEMARERLVGGMRWASIAVLAALIVLQPFGWVPYAIAYNSPFDVRPLSQQGWGEGLDAAARLLNEHPAGEGLVVASWYPGVMRTYFNGTTMSLSSRHDDRVGAVVLYRNMGGRSEEDVATDILREFDDRDPSYVVRIGDVEYVWVYETLGLHYFPKHIGELIGGMEVGQLVTVPENGWRGVEVGMATFSGRANTQDVRLEVREGAGEPVVRSVTVNAAELEDSQWHEFLFEEIVESGGKQYYVSLHSPGSRAGDAVTVRFAEKDLMPGEMVLRRRALREGEEVEDFVRQGSDLALRLLY